MASRRMFSVRLVSSARFLKMPISSQALYFHLGLHADDDGIVEAYPIIKTVGCTEDDLRVLVSKGFVQVLNEDLVSYILDWSENNHIRADRKIDSIYKDLLITVNPHVRLVEKRQMADAKKIMDGQWTGNGRTMDGIGKDSIGKDSIDKTNDHPVRKALEEEFDQAWSLYPRKQGKKTALEAYVRARGKGTQLEDVIKGINAYLAYIKAKKVGEQYVKQGSTFFRQCAWDDDWTVKEETKQSQAKYQFKGRNYNFAELEKQILQGGGS